MPLRFSCSAPSFRRSAMLLLGLLAAGAGFSAEVARRAFDIPADAAEKSLRSFAAQSGVEVLFSTQAAAGIRTNAVRGELTPLEAVSQMLAGTRLVVVEDSKNGILRISRAADPNVPRAAPATSDRPSPSQPRAAADDEKPIELSPFVIEAQADEGYVASSTLAGSRMRTPIKDVAAQISVFTPELMEDLGLTNLEEVYLYSSNVESYLEFTPTGADAANFGSFFVRSNTRIRGLGESSKLQNFFQTGFESDSYNTERVTIASGPNAILFGMGNAGGITDVSVKRANTSRNSRTFSYRTDSNASHRTTLDVNQVILKDRLALRFSGLNDHRELFRAPSTDSSERLYGALTFRPTKAITARVNAEWQTRSVSRPMMTAQYDFVTPWIDVGAPGFNNQGINANSAAAATTSRFTGALAGVLQREGGVPGVLVTGSSPPLPMMRWTGSALVRGPHELPGVRVEDDFSYSLMRPELWDPNVNAYGTGIHTLIGGRTLNGFVEYRVTRDLAIEIAAMREDVYEYRGGFQGNSLRIDPNLYLPDGMTPNPNFGKLYLQSNSNGARVNEDRRELRLSASYEHDFTRASGWRRWLGRHQLALLLSDTDNDDLSAAGWRATILGNPNFLQPAAQTNLRHASRQFARRQYIDRPGAGSDTFGKPVPGRSIHETQPMQLADSNGTPFEVIWWDDPRGQFNAAAGRKQNVLGRSLALRNYFLQDRLTTFFGWREDRVRLAFVEDQQVQTTTLPDGRVQMGLFPHWRTARYEDYSFYQTGRSMNWGVTAFPLRWLSLHYNNSENFAIQQGQRFTPYGEPVAGAGGKGKDYGFSVNLLGGKLSFRFNLYENGQLNNRPVNSINDPIVANPKQIENAMQTRIDPTLPRLGIDFDRYDFANYLAIADTNAKGADVELVANLTENWRLFMTVGRQRTTYDIRDVWWRWVEDRLPVWRTAGRGWDIETMNDSAKTIHQAYDEWVRTARDPFQAQSGRVSDRQREWRANLLANYKFTQGRLKGLSLGGGGRWRSAAVLGYHITTTPGGVEILDITRPFMGDEDLWVDASASYTFRDIRLIGNTTRWRLQLNVRNLLDSESLRVSKVTSDGRPAVYAFVPPRELIFTTTVEF